jgi:hypothetical protein
MDAFRFTIDIISSVALKWLGFVLLYETMRCWHYIGYCMKPCFLLYSDFNSNESLLNILHLTRHRDEQGQVTHWLVYCVGNQDSMSRRKRKIIVATVSRPIVGPIQLHVQRIPVSCIRYQSGHRLKPIIGLQLLPRIGMCVAMSPFRHTSL